VLTLEQIMAYKGHAAGAVLRDQQLEQARGQVTGQARTGQAHPAREGARKAREREKTAQEKFDEYFAQHGDRLRGEEQQRRQSTKERGR
jgi:hypothetical protein